MTARLYALELLITELLSAHLLTVSDSELEVAWAIDHLRDVVDAAPIGNSAAGDVVTLRAAAKDDLSRILKRALAQAKQVGLQRWDSGISRDSKT
jgi:hypothetical protein